MAARNWRRAYHESIHEYRRSWTKWRHEAPTTKIRVRAVGRVYEAGQLTDQQILELSQEVAAYDIEAAINQHNAATAASKGRSGIAL
jgi:hypothetical protein